MYLLSTLLSCPGCPVTVLLSQLSCPCCHVLSCPGCHDPADLSRPTCPHLPCHGYPVQAALSWLSCPGCPVMTVLSLSWHGCPATIAFASVLSSCPDSAVMSRMPCPSCSVPAVMGCPYMAVLHKQSSRIKNDGQNILSENLMEKIES